MGLILRSTAVATTSQSTVEGTRGYSTATVCTVASQPSVTVASEYPHSTLNSTGVAVATAVLCNIRLT